MAETILITDGCYIDPVGAVITYNGQCYYRDGILYGSVLPKSQEFVEQPIPTLWSSVVIKYRKKPVEVEAIQLGRGNAEEIAQWCGGLIVEEISVDGNTRYVGINIPTLEGVMRASEGDYVIKGVKGEFYPCKPEIFAATYELV